MLTLYRRHTAECPHRSKGQNYTKCCCPIWCYGQTDNRPVRESLKTRDWQRTIRRAAALESSDAPRLKPVAEAITAFEQHIQSLESSTQRKYKNVLWQFQAHCEAAAITDMGEITVEQLDAYRAGRKLARITAQKELETLRQFFAYCRDRHWVKDNPAKKIKGACNIKPAEVAPYTPNEVARILAACDSIGRTSTNACRHEPWCCY